MNRGWLLSLVVTVCISFCGSWAYAQTPSLGQVDVVAIRGVQIEQDKKGYWAHVVAVFKNGSSQDLKLKDFELGLALEVAAKVAGASETGKPDSGPEPKPIGVLQIGEAKIDDLDLPKATGGEVATRDVPLKVYVGPNNSESIKRIFALMNFIGDPSANVKILLEGKGAVGTKVEKGYIFQLMGASLRLEPSIKREALIQ